MQAGRAPTLAHLVGRATLVVFALVPLVLLLSRDTPPAPAGVVGAPAGLGGIGTGLLDPPSNVPSVAVSAAGPANVSPAPPAGRPAPAPAGVPGPPAGSTSPPAPYPTPETQPPPKPLRGSYAITGGDPNGTDTYQVTVTIINPAPVDQTGWSVTIKLPAGEVVTAASGATVAATAAAFRFKPSGNDTVPARGAVSFTFTVGGTLAGPPVSCRIDGRSCG